MSRMHDKGCSARQPDRRFSPVPSEQFFRTRATDYGHVRRTDDFIPGEQSAWPFSGAWKANVIHAKQPCNGLNCRLIRRFRKIDDIWIIEREFLCEASRHLPFFGRRLRPFTRLWPARAGIHVVGNHTEQVRRCRSHRHVPTQRAETHQRNRRPLQKSPACDVSIRNGKAFWRRELKLVSHNASIFSIADRGKRKEKARRHSAPLYKRGVSCRSESESPILTLFSLSSDDRFLGNDVLPVRKLYETQVS